MTSPERRSVASARTAPARRSRRVVRPDKKGLVARIRRIEGQVRGIAGMIEQDRYCVDVLTQIAAIQSALNGAAMQLLQDHATGCVRAAIKSGHGKQAIDELMQVVRRFAR